MQVQRYFVMQAVKRAVWSLLRLKVSDVSVQGSQPWVAGLTCESELLLGAVATVERRDVSHEAREVWPAQRLGCIPTTAPAGSVRLRSVRPGVMCSVRL